MIPANQSYDFGGDIGEIMIFTRKLGLTEEQQVEGYLAHKWGGTEALPADHPYKDVAPVFDNSPKLTPVIGQVGYDTVTREGLVGEWLFDDNDTAGTIADTSGNGYNGTNVNGTFSENTPIGRGHSLDFFGGNKYAWVSDGGMNRPLEEVMLSPWLYGISVYLTRITNRLFPSVEMPMLVG